MRLLPHEGLAGLGQLPLGWSLTWGWLGLLADTWILHLAFPSEGAALSFCGLMLEVAHCHICPHTLFFVEETTRGVSIRYWALGAGCPSERSVPRSRPHRCRLSWCSHREAYERV